MALTKQTILNDKYVLRSILGSNGPYDVTYLAWNLSKERASVVIREFSPSFIVRRTQDESGFEYENPESRNHFDYGLNCFVREAAAAALIDHPNVVRHEDYFRENETSYCVSSWHSGATLETVLEGHSGRMEKRAAFAIIMPLLDGLGAAHRQGLIHGRLSPDQIFLTKTGRPMLFRFHITRLLLARRCGRILDMNESGFTAPELLITNGKKGPWSDIYSCGATLYSMITGKKPPGVHARKRNDPFLDMLYSENTISPGLKKVLYRATSMNLEDRPQTVLELKQDLLNATMTSGREYGKLTRSTAYTLKATDFYGRHRDGALIEDQEGGFQPLFHDEQPLYSLHGERYDGGGDGYGGERINREPFFMTTRMDRAFVETNPLGPLANDPLLVEEPSDGAILEQASSSPDPVTDVARNRLRKERLPYKMPLLIGIVALLTLALTWALNIFERAGGGGLWDEGMSSEQQASQLVLPASTEKALSSGYKKGGQAHLPDAVADSSALLFEKRSTALDRIDLFNGTFVDSISFGKSITPVADSMSHSETLEMGKDMNKPSSR